MIGQRMQGERMPGNCQLHLLSASLHCVCILNSPYLLLFMIPPNFLSILSLVFSFGVFWHHKPLFSLSRVSKNVLLNLLSRWQIPHHSCERQSARVRAHTIYLSQQCNHFSRRR